MNEPLYGRSDTKSPMVYFSMVHVAGGEGGSIRHDNDGGPAPSGAVSGCSDRQIRTAAYSLHRRGLVALQKEARPGRQGLSLVVWEARTYRAWQNFIDPTRRDAHLTAQIEEERRLFLRKLG